ncbi:MAG: response regulator [Bacteroidetes bacterium]|nr:response regulator [Bacteroidota bacterium]
MAKILVVDDEIDLQDLITQRFRRKIRDKEYEFVFAINGNDALVKLAENPNVDIVLSDINMPEMDGLTLLGKLAESNPLLKSVIVSAYGDMENIRIAMNRGAYDFVTKPINFDDLTITMEKTLKHALHIKETLKAVKENNILKMYVDENVLHFMGSKEFEESLMSNEEIEASIVFVDICSFTALSEMAPADKVVRLLNDYFDIIVKEIIAEEGYIDKFIGDAVMAVFRGNDSLNRAAKASVNIQKKMIELPIIEELNSFKPEVSIGINKGEMISGNIGSATLKRLVYTVIGDVVNTAQRLQSKAEPGQIILNETCKQQLSVEFKCIEVGEVNLKNKREPMMVYQVVSSL